ncbi:transposable element Tcb2 transposase [Trichonephila clavipes]|uniref:Transposable element Tcb2 transposase n=1 Tax=Trichonephila clavipes TaxID=2585209 RepID=A0A8X7BN57_TRICX|nr:transposable element Tcb2 transposase [Trichonephila clavipes]
MFGTLPYDSPLPNQVKLNYPPIQQARQIAVNRTIKHHKINKQRYDKHYVDAKFKVGDLVLYQNFSYPNSSKLQSPYNGPFKVRLWDQYQSEDSVSRRPVPGRPRATTPAEDCFLALSARRRRTTTVPQLVADPFQASGRRISATTVRNRLHNAGLYARRQLCAFPSTDDSEGTAYAGQENMFLGRSNNGLLCCSQTSPDLQWRRWWNPGLGGISLGGHTDLHVFHGGTVTGLRYRDEILDPYAAAIGNDFILMDDNARPYRARIVEEYLEDHGLERMEWPARSPDLNPIEHLWDYLGREVAALNPPPRSLHELKQGLLCVWSSLPIPVSDNLINSMGNRSRQCIQVRGGHIPY